MDAAIVANLIAGLALLVSIVAILVSIHANRQANATQRRLVEIEEGRDRERVAAGRRADLRAEIREFGLHSERLYVINEGSAAAHDVADFLDGVALAEHDAAVANDPLSTVIGPRSEASCLLMTTLSCATPFDIRITWQDDSGEPREYRSTLTF
jgi:hypothetical protein